jgi:hypothetical protein
MTSEIRNLFERAESGAVRFYRQTIVEGIANTEHVAELAWEEFLHWAAQLGFTHPDMTPPEPAVPDTSDPAANAAPQLRVVETPTVPAVEPAPVVEPAQSEPPAAA